MKKYAFLFTIIMVSVACNKSSNNVSPLQSKIVGTWKEFQFAIDNNKNGNLDQYELTTVTDNIYFVFNKDLSGNLQESLGNPPFDTTEFFTYSVDANNDLKIHYQNAADTNKVHIEKLDTLARTLTFKSTDILVIYDSVTHNLDTATLTYWEIFKKQ